MLRARKWHGNQKKNRIDSREYTGICARDLRGAILDNLPVVLGLEAKRTAIVIRDVDGATRGITQLVGEDLVIVVA